MKTFSVEDLALCERGNTLLVNDDGNMVAWLAIEDITRLEVSWCPSNYPALNVMVTELTDQQLAEHINTKLGGWTVRRCNVEGVITRHDCVIGPIDTE